jgi:hypothetical protein
VFENVLDVSATTNVLSRVAIVTNNSQLNPPVHAGLTFIESSQVFERKMTSDVGPALLPATGLQAGFSTMNRASQNGYP